MAVAGAKSTAAPRSTGTLKKSVVEILVVAIVAAAIGCAASYSQLQLFSTKPAEPRPDQATETPSPPAATSVFHLPPLVTNLASPADVWVRLEVSLVIDTLSTPHPDVLSTEIAGDFLIYMRTLTLAQLEGGVGLQNLRQDLFERAAIRSGGKVTELVVRTLVIQ